MQEDVRSLQQALIDLLRKNDMLHSDEVAAAFMTVPRHLFLPGEPVERAYQDIAIQVRAGPDGRWTSASSQPAVMAIMLEQLDLQPGMRVLEIGAGTGFNAALMAVLVGPEGAVTAVDIQADLVEAAREHLQAVGLERVQVVAGDGGYGWPAGAPYDRIILTASSTTITPAWREQLVDGGRLVMPFDLGGAQVTAAFEKRGAEMVSVSLANCGFMPLQGSFGRLPVLTRIAEGIQVICPVDCGLEGAALEVLLAQQAETLPVGLRIKGEELWAGVFSWLAVRAPDRVCSLTALDEALSALEKPLPALQAPLMHFPSVYLGAENTGLWLLLPAPSGGSLLRHAPGEESPDGFALEVLALGDGLPAARELVGLLRAWDAAGRPRQDQLSIRAVDAASVAQPQAGEFLLERPWTKFMVGYG